MMASVFRVVLEHAQEIDVHRADDGVAPDAHASRLAQTLFGELGDDLIGERAALRDDADGAFLVNVARHDAHLAAAGRDDARAVRADEHGFAIFHVAFHVHHVAYRNALGDAHHEGEPCVHGLHDGVRREGGRHEDERGVRARLLHRLGDRVEHGRAVRLVAALAGRHAGHHRAAAARELTAVFLTLPGVKASFAPGDALHEDARFLVDQNTQNQTP